MSRQSLSDRENAFVQAYLADPKRNGAAAAVAAGYAPKHARVTASRLLTRDNIKAKIAQAEEKLREKALMTVHDVIERYADIARADPNALSSIEVAACRYCHGKDNAFQWRLKAEFENALTAWHQASPKKRPVNPPTDEGGYGYSRKLEPNPDCPMCDGLGEPRTVFRDTRTGHPLYAGVKETQHGIEIKTHDQMSALDAMGRILGVFEKDNKQRNPAGDLGNFVLGLIGQNKAGGITLNRADQPDLDGEEGDA